MMCAVDAIFEPRSVVVYGASRDERKLGHTLLRNIASGGFRGRVVPVTDAARAGCRAAIVLASGFGETGPSGRGFGDQPAGNRSHRRHAAGRTGLHEVAAVQPATRFPADHTANRSWCSRPGRAAQGQELQQATPARWPGGMARSRLRSHVREWSRPPRPTNSSIRCSRLARAGSSRAAAMPF